MTADSTRVGKTELQNAHARVSRENRTLSGFYIVV
jgi:hypothetical protein